MSANKANQELPIQAVIPDIIQTLEQKDELVLVAPPGAGKTTVVPIALFDTPWLQNRKILLLEPRRLAAKAAASRLAQSLNESVGDTVGYRVRLDSKVSDKTRIEVVTEGILTRYLQEDPSLEDIGLIIFDEFHERNLDADLGLSLSLQGRKLFRNPEEGCDPLKLLVMSATLEHREIAELLGNDTDTNSATVIESQGKMFPVDVHYGDSWQMGEYIVPRMVQTLIKIIEVEAGSVLVFLPGQREIRQTEKELQTWLDREDKFKTVIEIAPLFGDLTLQEQQKAIEPAPDGTRKIVLATNIAESSLTINGITIVVDSGLTRETFFDPRTGMTRLHTRRLSKASSTQRMGRAGRLAPGKCFRLWSASQQDQLEAQTAPEILQADLCSLALQLLCWGIEDPSELDWLTLPPKGPYQQALDLLHQLGAIKKNEETTVDSAGSWQVTPHGEEMEKFPAHPRLAHMLLMAKAINQTKLGCDLAVILSEKDPLRNWGVDIQARIDLLNGDIKTDHTNKSLVSRFKVQSRQLQQKCKEAVLHESTMAIEAVDNSSALGFLIACAYPDRIAKAKGSPSNTFQLSNGRSVRLREGDSLQNSNWLAVAQLGGHKDQRTDNIYMAGVISEALFSKQLAGLIRIEKQVQWDSRANRFSAEEKTMLGAIEIKRRKLENIPQKEKITVLVNFIRKQGLEVLPWTEEISQWRDRVNLLFQMEGSDQEWPDLSDDYLLNTLDNWLTPFLGDISHLNDFKKLDLANILLGLLPWPLPQKLDELAPERIRVASGSSIKVDYSQNPPVLAVRLQEMFGMQDTPMIGNGKVKLMVHLLSPARRPLQVTQDLKSFWENTYTDVKKDMKGRYPKHYWPDNPLEAEATSRAKPRK